MANPFDQFDAPVQQKSKSGEAKGGNPFDQFDATAQDLQATGIIEPQQMPDLTADELSRLPENPAEFVQTLSQPNAEWVQRQYQLKSDMERRPQTNAELLARSAGNVGKGILQAGVNVANILPEVTDIVKSAGAAAGGALGLSDGMYYPSPRLELPEELKPQSEVGKLTAEVAPYLLPTGAERLAVKGAGLVEKGARKVAELVAENLPGALASTSGVEDERSLPEALAVGVAGSVAGRGVANAVGKLGGQALKTAREWSSLTPAERAIREAEEAARIGAGSTSPTAQNQAGQSLGKYITGKDYSAVAGEVLPQASILKAAKDLDMEDALLPSHYSQSQTYRAVEQGLKSIPASQLRAQEYNTIQQLAQKADDLIALAGGTTNKVHLSDKFKVESQKAIDDLGGQADRIYKEIGRAIPAQTPTAATYTLATIMRRAKNLGGEEHLSTVEKSVLKSLREKPSTTPGGPATKPTYALVDDVRKDIGDAISKKSGPFKDEAEGKLKLLYSALTRDQGRVAKNMGMGDKWDVAKGLIRQRKDLEKGMVSALGKDLSGSLGAELAPAIKGLRTGDVQAFDKLLAATPAHMRQEVVASALNDVFTMGSRKEQQLSIPGFVDWYAGAKKSGAINRVMQHLPKETRRNLANIYRVSSGIRRANEEAISTGRVTSLIKAIDDRNGVLDHLYGAAEKGAAIAGGTLGSAAGGALGAAAGSGLGAALGQAATKALQRPPRSIAADALLADPSFRNALIRATPKNRELVSKSIENLPAWKQFIAKLSDKEAKKVAKAGALAWMMDNNNQEE